MPTKLNLASKPFTNRALPWLISAALILISLVSLVYILGASTRARSETAELQREINKLGLREQELRQQAQQVKNSLTPDQLQTLSAAHALVDRKHFSWSRLLADLEASLPGDARVKRIAVRGISSQGGQTLAELELAVIAKSSNVVTGMIADMDKGGVFQAELRAQTLQRGRGETGAEYELFVIYRPRSGYATDASAVASVASAQGSEGSNR